MLALFNYGSKLRHISGNPVIDSTAEVLSSAFPKGPTIADLDISDSLSVAKSFYSPPQQVIGATLAQTWQITYDISADDWNLAGSGELERSPTLNDYGHWSEEQDTATYFDEADDTESASYIRLSVTTGTSLQWSQGRWTIPITVLVTGINETRTFSVSSGFNDYESGITLTACGVTRILGSETEPPEDSPVFSGTITVTPLTYIPFATFTT